MRINEAGLALVKHFEGRKLRAYLDPVGVWTIGYGHTITAKKGMVITEAEAERLLRDDLRFAEEAVANYIRVPLNANQHAALVSWVFNVGAGALKDSTLRQRLNEGDYAAVPAQLVRWNKGTFNGVRKELAGLTRRRKAEADLWETPVEVTAPAAPLPSLLGAILALIGGLFRGRA